MELRCRVLVIGGGPAGSTAARILAGERIDTILLEKNLSFAKPCGGGMPSGAFSELKIPHEAIKRKITKIRIVSPGGETLEIGLKGGFIAIVKRGEYDSMLRDEAQKAGAQIIEADFRHLEEKNRHLIAHIEINGNPGCIKTDYIIAADGVNSRVRLAAGLKLQPSLYTISERISGMDTDACEFWFGSSHAPKTYSWIFPSAEGVSAGTGSLEPGRLKNLLKNFSDRRGVESKSDTRIYKIPLWSGEVYNKNNILFAGDSAGHVLPLTYEGIYHAMKSGEFAARAIIEGNPSYYKKLWKRRFYSRFLLMKKIEDYFLKDDGSAEKLVSFFRRQEVQDVAMMLWLEKSSGRGSLITFINFFRRILS